jgi:hypothetical protein
LFESKDPRKNQGLTAMRCGERRRGNHGEREKWFALEEKKKGKERDGDLRRLSSWGWREVARWGRRSIQLGEGGQWLDVRGGFEREWDLGLFFWVIPGTRRR